MNITEAKAQVVNLLEGFHPISYVPEGVTPPVVVIRNGNPYLEPGRTFGDYTLNLNVLVMGPPATNEEASRYLDQTVMDVLPILEDSAWAIDSISPELYEGDGALYPSVAINIFNQVNF